MARATTQLDKEIEKAEDRCGIYLVISALMTIFYIIRIPRYYSSWWEVIFGLTTLIVSGKLLHSLGKIHAKKTAFLVVKGVYGFLLILFIINIGLMRDFYNIKAIDSIINEINVALNGSQIRTGLTKYEKTMITSEIEHYFKQIEQKIPILLNLQSEVKTDIQTKKEQFTFLKSTNFVYLPIKDSKQNITGYEISLAYTFPDTIFIPSSYEGRPVTKISDNAFKGHDTLVAVEIPSSITDIGRFAFQDCKKLVYFLQPNRPDCKYELNDSIRIIRESAFAGCRSLSLIQIPRVQVILGEAFKDCNNLTIYSKHEYEPAEWSKNPHWNPSNRPVKWNEPPPRQ